MKTILFLAITLLSSFNFTVLANVYMQDAEAEKIRLAQSFVSLLAKNDFDTAFTYFDDTMKTAMPRAKLEETWNAVVGQAGAFKQQVKATTEKRGDYIVVHDEVEFANTPAVVNVVLDKSNRVAGLFFAPAKANPKFTDADYVKTSSFTEREVTIGSGEWELPGTLTLPVGAGLFPVVVLVHGSGPEDRDESYGPNKVFRDLAGGLASRGVAVLRYEKRTKQHGPKLAAVKEFTVKDETIDDAVSAIDLLRKTPHIDPKRIFVLGHSLGGMLLPRIAKLDPGVAGLISFAGATRPLEDVIPEQLTYIFSLDGSVSKEEQVVIDKARQDAAAVKALKSSTDGAGQNWFGAPASYWLDLRGYDPPLLAKSLKQPMLILQGERDYQVTMADLERWRAALSLKKNVTFKTYATLNHFFIEGSGKSTPSEYDQPGHVFAGAIDDIANWIKTAKS